MLERIKRQSTMRSVAAKELDDSFRRLNAMDGREFELFVARIFLALGYDVKLTPATGDQGVDVLVENNSERVAIQCKNLARSANNKPVQEVHAGAKYYGASRAWVVAPAGYTSGAFQLADRVDVELYDLTDIEKWIERVNISGKAELYMTDAEIYEVLVEQHTEYLKLLIEAGWARQQAGQDAEVEQSFERTKATVENQLTEVLSKMAVLDARNPGETDDIRTVLTETRASVRQMVSFLDLATRVGVAIASYEQNLDAAFRESSSESAVRKIVLRPQIFTGEDTGEESILDLSNRAFVKHAAEYPIEVEVAPVVKTLPPNHSEKATIS
jgi:hypothetical protein